jgi:hypothetical protein
MIHFRLACYAALLEDIKSTRAHLTAAINLDPSPKVKAFKQAGVNTGALCLPSG